MPAMPFPAAPPSRPDPSSPSRTTAGTAFWPLFRLFFFLPALAPLAAFLFASFWFASDVLLGVGTISLGLLGAFAAMLAFDCLPDGALTGGPFGLIRRIPPTATGGAAAREYDFSVLLFLYSAVFWVFALTLVAIAARILLA
ncbi:MAG: hypothetical protein ACREFN_19320 [Acetobacteraceae bacterium]